MPLREGDQILESKYQILRLIGQGASARVWLAEEPRFGNRRVAIKEPRADLLPESQQELRRRYDQEIQLAPQLQAAGVPSIVPVYTLETLPDGAHLLVMQYMEGGSLAELIAREGSGLPLEQALTITGEVLEALAAFHDLPAAPVHRDVKPENILFDGRGKAHLGDFGLAQLPGQSGRSQLQGGTHPGTPLYMAPEQGRSPEPLMPAADLFALGCVFFEMLAGKRYKRVRPGTPCRALRPDLPSWLEPILARTLAEDPWDRYGDAAEMAQALAEGPAAARREAEEARQRREAEEARKREEARRRAAEERARREAEEARQRVRRLEEQARQHAEASASLETRHDVAPGGVAAAAPKPWHRTVVPMSLAFILVNWLWVILILKDSSAERWMRVVAWIFAVAYVVTIFISFCYLITSIPLNI